MQRRTKVKVAGAIGLVSAVVSLLDAPAKIRNFVGPSIEIKLSKDRIVRGEEVVVSWKVVGNATEVLLDDKPIAKEDTQSFHPVRNQTFRFVAKHPWWNRLNDEQFRTIYVDLPAITATLEVSATQITPDQEITIAWTTKNAEKVLIEPLHLLGSVGRSGTKPVLVSDTTTFRLIATSADSAPVVQEKTVTVLRTELDFEPDPPQVYRSESAKLRWRTNAQSIEILPGVGTFSEPLGETSVVPQETTTYEAVANGPSGPVRKTVIVTVLPPRSPRLRAWFEKQNIRLGEFASIRWQAENAELVTVEYGGVSRELRGQDSYQFTPSVPGVTEVHVIAHGPGGQDDVRIALEVLPPLPPTVSASIDPNKVILGEVATLRWRSENADHVALRGLGRTEQLPSSGNRPVQPDRKGTLYLTLVASGRGGETKMDIRLEVLAPPAPKIIILETPPNYSSYSSLAKTVTETVRAYLTGAGYEVLSAPQGIRSLEDFSAQYDRLVVPKLLQSAPDYVLQATAEVNERHEQSLGTTIIGEILKRVPQGARPSNRYINVVSTCIVNIRVIRMPERLDFAHTASAQMKESRVVDQQSDWRANQSDLTRKAAERAATDAVTRLVFER